MVTFLIKEPLTVSGLLLTTEEKNVLILSNKSSSLKSIFPIPACTIPDLSFLNLIDLT